MQDTSQLTYSTQYKKQGIGPLKNKYQKGILLHPTLAVTPSKLCLGVIDDYHWFREKLLNVKKKERSQLNLKTPITEKESYRWILSSQKMNQLAKELPEQQFINIADREGDIYELYHEASSQQRAPNLDYLIRAVKNRPLLNQQSGKKSATNLWDTIQNESAKYQIKFKLPKRGNKPSRWVTQVLRSKTVCLLPPYRRKGLAPLPSLQMNAVIASEINPPANEKPIKWLFLTSLPITTPEELKLILNFYLSLLPLHISPL